MAEQQFERTITLQEVLKKIDAGEWCDLEFVKADRKRGTAGAIGSLQRCVKSSREERPAAPAPERRAGSATGGTRAANHYQNSTRNMYEPASKKMRKVHIRLITKYNGLRVI